MTWDAILADLDGTLVDTDDQHDMALTRAARGSGFWKQFTATRYSGRSTDRLRAYAAEWGQVLPGVAVLDAQVEAIQAQKWIELEEVLRDCRPDDLDPAGHSRVAMMRIVSLDLPLRIVTDTPRACADLICQVLGWETELLVTRDDVGGIEKPDPAIYLLARSQIEALKPVALEDSLRGAHAASAAHIPSFLVHGPEGVIAWLKTEFSMPAAFTTIAAKKRRSGRRRSASSTRSGKRRS